jgi:hypothetical protein
MAFGECDGSQRLEIFEHGGSLLFRCKRNKFSHDQAPLMSLDLPNVERHKAIIAGVAGPVSESQKARDAPA